MRGCTHYFVFCIVASLRASLCELVMPKIISFTVDSVIGNEDVLGLYISVDDIVLFAKNKGRGNVLCHLNNGVLGNFGGQGINKGSEKLHLDKDVPADAVVVLDVAHIVAVDDVGASVHFPLSRLPVRLRVPVPPG